MQELIQSKLIACNKCTNKILGVRLCVYKRLLIFRSKTLILTCDKCRLTVAIIRVKGSRYLHVNPTINHWENFPP
ncbi:MAG: hypothetical protein ACFFDT_00275 [Candidatus Hodarchaeota archaeon]